MERGFNNYTTIIWLCIAVIGLFLENSLIAKWQCSYAKDCYFMLIPLSIIMFSVMMYCEKYFNNAKMFRKISRITFRLHMSASLVIQFFYIKIGLDMDTIMFGGMIWYCIVVLFCFLCSVIVDKFEMKDYIKWMKYLC